MITIKGTLPIGLKLGDEMLKEFELRPASTVDMIRAEIDAPTTRRLAYTLALAGQQLLRIGTLQGPIQFDRMQELDPEDVNHLLAKQEEVEALAKKSRSGTADTSSPSPPSASAPDSAGTT